MHTCRLTEDQLDRLADLIDKAPAPLDPTTEAMVDRLSEKLYDEKRTFVRRDKDVVLTNRELDYLHGLVESLHDDVDSRARREPTDDDQFTGADYKDRVDAEALAGTLQDLLDEIEFAQQRWTAKVEVGHRYCISAEERRTGYPADSIEYIAEVTVMTDPDRSQVGTTKRHGTLDEAVGEAINLIRDDFLASQFPSA